MVEAHEFEEFTQKGNPKHSKTSGHEIMKVYDFSSNFDELEKNLRHSKSLQSKSSSPNYLVASPNLESTENGESITTQPSVLWAFYHDSIGQFKDT